MITCREAGGAGRGSVSGKGIPLREGVPTALGGMLRGPGRPSRMPGASPPGRPGGGLLFLSPCDRSPANPSLRKYGDLFVLLVTV